MVTGFACGIIDAALTPEECDQLKSILCDLDASGTGSNQACGFWAPAASRKRPRATEHRSLQEAFIKCRSAVLRGAHWIPEEIRQQASEPRAGIEWWWRVHCGGSYESAQLHIDRDEHAMIEEHSLRTPLVSALLYLTTQGNPTLVLDQTLKESTATVPESAAHGFVSTCRPGRLLVFDGSLIHTVLPDHALPQDAQHSCLDTPRVVCVLNFWACPPAECFPLWPVGTQTHESKGSEEYILTPAVPASTCSCTLVTTEHKQITLHMDISPHTASLAWSFHWPELDAQTCTVLRWDSLSAGSPIETAGSIHPSICYLSKFIQARREAGSSVQQLLQEFHAPNWVLQKKLFWDTTASLLLDLVQWQRELDELIQQLVQYASPAVLLVPDCHLKLDWAPTIELLGGSWHLFVSADLEHASKTSLLIIDDGSHITHTPAHHAWRKLLMVTCRGSGKLSSIDSCNSFHLPHGSTYHFDFRVEELQEALNSALRPCRLAHSLHKGNNTIM